MSTEYPRSTTPISLLALRPENIELDVRLDPLTVEGVRFRPENVGSDARPYVAWPEYGRLITAGAGSHIVTADRAAMYCIGVLLYHMLSDRALFEAEDLIAMALRHLNESPPELHLGNRYSGLARITRQCLAKEPADRPASLLAL